MGQPEPVRVLHVVKGLGPGGAERLLVSMTAAADPTAVHQEVAYVLDWKQHLVPELQALGVETHLLAGARGMADPRWPTRLRALARSFDVVHLHSPAVAAVARVTLRTLRRPPLLVSTEHNVWGSHDRLTRMANAATGWLDEVRWAVSDEVAGSMSGRSGKTVETLVYGIPVAAIERRRSERPQARAGQGWRDGDVVVAVVANLRANKDYPTLFEAAALAMGEEPALRFVSIGQGQLEVELRRTLASHDLGDRFTMLGYHADPVAVLAGADIFTLSSRHEGLPISLLEAMALGLPSVVTDVGGVPEVVDDGVHGLVVPAGEPAALAEGYVRLARSAGERERLGRAASTRAAEFDIRRTARLVEDRYRRIVAERRHL